MIDNPQRTGIFTVVPHEPTIPAPARERVRDLLSQGHTPREIAEIMRISTQAVYAHMKKLKESAA